MAVIIDPDKLVQGTEVVINTTAKTIKLAVAGNLSNDGVTGQCLYSFLKESWKSDNSLFKFPFPMTSITNEQFEFNYDWIPADEATRKLIRTAGWAEISSASATKRVYAGIISLGSIATSDQPYYQQTETGAAVNTSFTGAVNEAVQIFGDSSNGAFDSREYFKLFVREQGKKYSSAQLSDIGVNIMTSIVYRFPLTNSADLKISHTDTQISTLTPYTDIDITYYAVNQKRTIGSIEYDFKIIIDGANATAEQIYEKIQYSLRQATDIDAGAGTVSGKTASDLLTFTGDTLATSIGVYIDNFATNDTNRLQFYDATGVMRTYPYVASVTFNFNDNLQQDTNAVFRAYFTNDEAGANLGYDFGTANAIVVKDAANADMSGSISGRASVSFSYDYDGNIQRGAASVGTDAPVTVVAIGLGTGQYVKSTGTITKSTANTVSLVAALERNYTNPA